METAYGANRTRHRMIVLDKVGVNAVGRKGFSVPAFAEKSTCVPETARFDQQDALQGCLGNFHEGIPFVMQIGA